MFVAATQILRTDGTGPSHGIMIMARFLNDLTIKQLKEQTQVDFSVEISSSSNLSEKEKLILSDDEGDLIIFSSKSDSLLHTLAVLSTVEKEKSLLIRTSLPRPILEYGLQTSRFVSLVILASLLLIIFSFMVVFLWHKRKITIHQLEIEALVDQRTGQLLASETKFKALTEAASEGVIVIEQDKFIAINSRLQEMFGYDETDLLNKELSDLITRRKNYKNKPIANNFDELHETEGIRRDGAIFPLLIHKKSITYQDKTVTALLFRDLTKVKLEESERNRLEEQLVRSKKMESIGQLAAGIAHDLNNILSGIVTYPQLLLIDLPDDSPLKKPLQAIQKSGNRASVIVQDMLTLAQKGMIVEEIIDPTALVKTFIRSPESMQLEQTHPGVRINLVCPEEVFNIKGSPVHLKKTLMNLVINALDAIEGKGDVTIALKNIYIDQPIRNYESLMEGDYVCMSVIDTGTGISSEDLPQVFEPFYSKKVLGRSGTGLGMAIIWNTIKDHKGYIDIESEVGVGTKIHLYLPVTKESLQGKNVSSDIFSLEGQGEKILVVDDVAVQRQIATTLLSKLNYNVESVSGGVQAIDYLEKQTPDLIILDMIMEPGIDGLETCKEIFRLQSDALIIIVSGYSKDEMIKKALSLGAKKFIKKPYSVETLGSAVKTILDYSR